MILPFFKLSPGGNTTLLFEAPDLSPAAQRAVAAEALSQQHLAGEQAGFLCLEEGTLHMAGGEFCLNAARCLGFLLAQRAGIAEAPAKGNAPRVWRGQGRVSGLAGPVSFEVHLSANRYHVSLTMPLHPVPLPQTMEKGYTVVRLPGITHLLIDDALHPFSPTGWREEGARARARFGLAHEDAVGCVWWRQAAQDHSRAPVPACCFLAADPVVAVREPRTECHERACGSGALALALALHAQGGAAAFSIMQPGGSPLTVHLHAAESGLHAEVGGPVSLVARGQAHFTPLTR